MAPSETSQEPPIVIPRPVFPDQAQYPNYLLLNGQVYNLERVNCDTKQAMDAVQDFYRTQYEGHVTQNNEAVADILREVDGRELSHLARARARGAITVTPTMFDKTIIVQDNLLWEVRTVLYEPEEVKTDHAYLDQNGVLETAANREFYRQWEGRGNIIINIKCPFKAVIDFRYSPQANIIKMETRTFHGMHDTRLCTNEVDAGRIWSGNQGMEFARYVNRINMFSMATNHITITNLLTRREEEYRIKHLLNPANVISITEEVTSQWRT